MSLYQQIKCLIKNTNYIEHKETIPVPASIDAKETLLRIFKEKKPLFISGILLGLAYYILAPSLSNNKDSEMFTKRPDKHVTGLINLRNDCFANSSLQAYLALPLLTDYLNEFILSFLQLKSFLEEHSLGLEIIPLNPKPKGKSKFDAINKKFEIPLHIALAKIIRKLQETRMSSKAISVWTFLHALEGIFDAKISRSQHDAHELTQLINECLENENGKIIKKLAQLKTDYVKEPEILSKLDKIEIPELPFSGLILTQMRCLRCNSVSKPSFTPFLMLTLATPEELSTTLESMLDENQSEHIDGYQCLRCRLARILENEKYMAEQGKETVDDKEKEILDEITKIYESSMCINDDLEPGLDDYVKSYDKNGVKVSEITSSVLRRHQILKPPKIFGIHLSRSSFNGVDVIRNSCHVSFKDHLSLSIGKEYLEELKQFQTIAREEDMESENINSNILTTDVNDMEDEDVQREDIEENGPENDDDESITEGDNTDTEDLTEENSSDATSISSSETAKMDSASLKDKKGERKLSDTSSMAVKAAETLNNAPITEDQTDELKSQFKTFKFNENDIYKYKLRAVIKHQGSHSQGHYECFRRKPLFVKDKDGTIFKLSPEISENLLEERDSSEHDTLFSEQEKVERGHKSDNSSVAGRRKKFSISLNHRPSILNDSESRSASGSHVDASSGTNSKDDEDGTSGLRRKFSTMMGRRPSIFQADPGNIQEIIGSGLNTPAELVVEKVDTDYFSAVPSSQPQKESHQNSKESPQKVKMKKIPSLIKRPFWKISDTEVTEVSRGDVCCETSSVYMLYFERVDRKQIKA